MTDTANKFQIAARDIEIEIMQNDINLLNRYIAATDPETKNKISGQFHPMTRGFISHGHKPDELITQYESAIKLNKYRPKNMSLFLLAVSNDLNNIQGEFNTFDLKLSQMSKDPTKDDEIRNRFNVATVNRYNLAKQFAYDWFRRLNNHNDLVAKVKNAKPGDEIAAYNALFQALARDFCDEYNLHPQSINVAAVKNWETADFKPSSPNQTGAYKQNGYSITLPKDMSPEQQKSVINEFKKSPKTHPDAIEQKIIRLNLDFAKRNEAKNGTKTFDRMIAMFAHEMHHALDDLKPRAGALGPQIQKLDKKTYTEIQQNFDDYHKSATELSSYAIENEIINQMKNIRD